MIKVETIGMIDVAKVNPVLTSENDVTNYQFITHDEDVYLVANTLSGDDCGKEDVVIKAGDYLNGFLVKAWEGQKLVIDKKHIDAGEGFDAITDETVLTIDENGNLTVGSKPESGVYFKVTEKCTLTERAVKAKVVIA